MGIGGWEDGKEEEEEEEGEEEHTLTSTSVEAMLDSLRYSMDHCCSSWLGLRDWLSDWRTCGGGTEGGRLWISLHTFVYVLTL